jgi:hypothetical protein
VRLNGKKDKLETSKETFSVLTKHGTVEDVPFHPWKHVLPYWPRICKGIFEVLEENHFRPYSATMKRPDGFVASSYYWRKSREKPNEIPLWEARLFISKLIASPDFNTAIKEFNATKNTDWLDPKNIATLGGFLYSFYLILKRVLVSIEVNGKRTIKPLIKNRTV